MKILEADNTTFTLIDLIPNTNYNISICAATSVGCGPFAEVTNSTDEDSKYHHSPPLCLSSRY